MKRPKIICDMKYDSPKRNFSVIMGLRCDFGADESEVVQSGKVSTVEGSVKSNGRGGNGCGGHLIEYEE